MLKRISILVLTCVALLSWKHEYHVSITQIDYNSEAKALQLSMKLHDEDVELLLENNMIGISSLEREMENKSVDEFLMKYINRSFSMRQGETPLEIRFIGKELEDDALWVYFESSGFDEMPSLTVESTLFLEVFHDQSNMVHYSKDDQVVLSTVLNKEVRSHLFEVK